MCDWNIGLGTLSEEALSRLAHLLDNSDCGWRQLASMVTEQPRYRCSEKEMTSCSLQVLSPTGSPGRFLLAMLGDRSCPLGFLLHCLKKMDHQDAVQYLTTTVTEQIRVTLQPQSQHASEGARVVLVCRATGPAGLAYRWFRGKDEIIGGWGPELVLSPLTSAHQGYYICRVNHGDSCVFSQWARVHLARPAGTSSGGSSSFFLSATSGLQIVRQPRAQVLSEGEALGLECLAEANPPAQYQWYHNKKPLSQPQAQTCSLRIQCVTTADRGQYSCKVFNLYHEMWSDQVHVNIGPSFASEASWAEVGHSSATPGPDRQRSTFYATDKVALLMGNMNYQHHCQLRAPMADVHELTNQLRQLDFKVVSLLDLSWQEMHSAVMEFLLLLDKGVYGLLYFAGHGYENYGNSFMVPIDAPASYTSEHCLWVQDILQKMQDKETGLNVFLLDMCRKRNLNDDVIQQPGPLKVTANIVFGYATCVDAEAFEVNKDDLSNGIFISYLKQRLCEDEKVTVMLDRVAEDMGRCAITRGRQALELRSNLSERRALTDLIQGSTCPAAASARNMHWAIAHVLPESRNLQFDCGVKVQLGFAAEFSNIMIIYTRILETPKDISYCSAHVTDLPEVLDIDVKRSNHASLQEAGSLLLTMDPMLSPELPSLYTRIKDLQRLKMELTFTVCLQYQYSNLDEEVEERQEIGVGKPLVSKLNLYEPRLHSASSDLLSSCSLPESSSFPEGLGPSYPGSETSSIGSASTSWSYFPQSGDFLSPSTNRVNQPEETDSPDMLDSNSPQSLTTSKSLPHGHVDDTYQFSDMRNFHSC
ncbi:MALT paracaspase 2 isoform X1 [Osmerus mordax]|uniref:MALT paracaspase 2 isoform X1 n=2 Tax=Osmerus mordax TaxID=8014 RepID=UPI00350F3D77